MCTGSVFSVALLAAWQMGISAEWPNFYERAPYQPVYSAACPACGKVSASRHLVNFQLSQKRPFEIGRLAGQAVHHACQLGKFEIASAAARVHCVRRRYHVRSIILRRAASGFAAALHSAVQDRAPRLEGNASVARPIWCMKANRAGCWIGSAKRMPLFKRHL